MSKSTDDTNELESYGVWVKHPSDSVEETSLNDIAADSSEELDLPDFDDSDFSDMFKDDNDNKSDNTDNFIDDDNTTLSVDELANITSTADAIEETPSEPAAEDVDNSADDAFDISFDEIPEVTEDGTSDIDLSDFGFDENAEESPAPAETTESAPAEAVSEAPEEEISLESFGFEAEVPDSTETAPSASEPAEESSGEEEISLDDFLDEGFSDESVASGNNGFSSDTAAPVSSASEEISLDDFGFSDIEEKAPQEAVEETPDEAPLEMNLNFDDSVDTIETEDNSSVDSDFDLDNTEETPVEEIKTEEVTLDDFTSDSSELATESIDLADFGIDSDAEETPVTQDVTSAKSKENKVDYDLSVGTANSAAPVVTEVEDKIDSIDEVQEITETVTPAAASDSTSISNSLLQQIVNDLSGLKNEINQLKSNLEEIKTSGFTAENKKEEEPVFDESLEQEPEKEESGFFSNDDGDDTIALSFDELDNIMNTADLTNDDSVSDAAAEETKEEPVVDDNLFVEPETTETSVELPADDLPESVELTENNTEAAEESFIEETEEPALVDEDLPSEISIPKYEETSETFDIVSTKEESEISEEPAVTVEDNDIDSMFVEPEASDSVEETAADVYEEPAETVIEEAVEEPVIESVEETSEEIVEEPAEPIIEEAVEETIIESVEAPSEEIFEEPAEQSIEEAAVESVEETIEEPNFDIGEELSNDFVEEEAAPVTDESNEEAEAVSENDLLETSLEEAPADAEDSIFVEPETSEEPSDATLEATSVDEFSEPLSSEVSDNIEDIVLDDSDTIEPELMTEENEEPVIEETSVQLADEELEDTEIPTVEAVLAENNAAETEKASENEGFASDAFDPFVSTATDDVTENDINLLTADEKPEDTEKNAANEELKKDIKSVLIYMDQLLENLPEDKIIEFAKSDEFTTYKKLFSELGLS